MSNIKLLSYINLPGFLIVFLQVPHCMSKLQDLDHDVLLETFHMLELNDFLSLADTDYRFRALIAQHVMFRRCHSSKKLQLLPPLENDVKIEFTDDCSINIYDQNLILKFLRYFGHLFSYILTNQFRFQPKFYARFHSYVNKYSSESLEEFRMDKFSGNLFLEWKKPFKNVSSLYIRDGFWNCEKVNVNFSEIFPSLRHLTMNSSSKCIDYHFPHLEYIQFSMYSNYPEIKKKIYEKIFDLNPQLRTIQISNFDNFHVLRVASQKLHNLEVIELSGFISLAERESVFDWKFIHFKSVKRLNIKLNRYDVKTKYIPLKFDQLEELVILGSSTTFSERWMEFIRQQQKLKILIILWKDFNLQE